MEDLWKQVRSFAEEAAKKSQTVTNSAKITDLVSETAKRSRKFAAEVSKKANEIKTAALKQADQIKSLSVSNIIPPQLSSLSNVNSASASAVEQPSSSELKKFGVTDDSKTSSRDSLLKPSSTFQSKIQRWRSLRCRLRPRM